MIRLITPASNNRWAGEKICFASLNLDSSSVPLIGTPFAPLGPAYASELETNGRREVWLGYSPRLSAVNLGDGLEGGQSRPKG